jgi:enoyl-CoA hydratase/carnithine racemase
MTMNATEQAMPDIVTEHAGSILRIQLNRPAKKNALTSSMYSTIAELLDDAAKDDRIRVVLWHGAGDSFTAGNDLDDFMKNPPGPKGSPQARLNEALMNFPKPLVAAVHGVAIGSGTTMLAYCDFVVAGESTRFQVPFVNLGLVPEFGSSLLLPLRVGYVHAADVILLGQPFDASQAATLGLATWVVSDRAVLATANDVAQRLAEKPAEALQACKRLMTRPFRAQLEQAVTAETKEFAARVRSADAREAFTAFFEKRRPDFTKSQRTPTSARATNGS